MALSSSLLRQIEQQVNAAQPTREERLAQNLDRFAKNPNIKLGQLLDLSMDELVDMVKGLCKKYKNVQGIAEIYDCSYNTALKIKNSGFIDDAIEYESPKVFYTDIKKALRLYPACYVIRRPRKNKQNN